VCTPTQDGFFGPTSLPCKEYLDWFSIARLTDVAVGCICMMYALCDMLRAYAQTMMLKLLVWLVTWTNCKFLYLMASALPTDGMMEY